jgi:hypothetical protein
MPIGARYGHSARTSPHRPDPRLTSRPRQARRHSIRREGAGKTGPESSVSRILSGGSRRRRGHSSRPGVAARLQRSTRGRCRLGLSPSPAAGRAARLPPPYLTLLHVGFAVPPTVAGGAVRSYRTLSPLPDVPRVSPPANAPGGLLSVALSVASPRLAVSEHAARRSSDFPPRAPVGRALPTRAATAWSSPAPADHNNLDAMELPAAPPGGRGYASAPPPARRRSSPVSASGWLGKRVRTPSYSVRASSPLPAASSTWARRRR